jgi:hypothetical protein
MMIGAPVAAEDPLADDAALDEELEVEDELHPARTNAPARTVPIQMTTLREYTLLSLSVEFSTSRTGAPKVLFRQAVSVASRPGAVSGGQRVIVDRSMPT